MNKRIMKRPLVIEEERLNFEEEKEEKLLTYRKEKDYEEV